MHKITDKIAALPPGELFHSLEFFPPKTSIGFQNLHDRLQRMSLALRPLFVTVTWGAGGSTVTGSLALAEICQRQLNLTTCLHLTCTNMSKATIDHALSSAKNLGIRNILALRGDHPRTNEYRDTPCDGTADGTVAAEFVWAIDLVRYIRQEYGNYFCIGVAAYPEGHAEGAYPELQDPKLDLPYLVNKVNAGADFIMTQLFFDVEAYLSFEKMLREEPTGSLKDIPIIPGLMPIQSYSILRRTTKLSHASLPQTIQTRLDAVKGDDEKVKQVGVDIVSEIVQKIKSTTSYSNHPRGFHFYTLNLEKAVSFIIERCDLIPPPLERAIVLEEFDGPIANGEVRRRRTSSVTSDPHNRVIVDDSDSLSSSRLASAEEAGFLKPPEQTRPPEVALAISEGEGALGREATWDDFPNGRFGDARSPAFGEIDGYGPSLHLSQPQAIKLWGYPLSASDISAVFINHIKGELHAIPWSEEPLSSESKLIQEQLIKLNSRGWWTVASQPAVNGARSNDPLFGWGPTRGFVFQRAFVEFFCPPEEWQVLKEKLGELEDIAYYAATKDGSYTTNMSTIEEVVNAVTWGVFAGKEIITPTIIEEVSFKAWKDEAFSLWCEWSKLYPTTSTSATLLKQVAEKYVLVNLIHHDYTNPEALWNLLGV